MTTERNSRAISGTECRVTSVDGEKKDRGISGENRAEESVVLPAETEEKKRRMIRRLLTWYHENRRILPWREDPTPYHVWLSEIMLQQTRVEAVKEYYARSLSVLPDISSLAAAPEDQVMKLWEGLGYYSRARNLQKAAKVVCSEYQGRMPETASALRKLPGIGAYTAAKGDRGGILPRVVYSGGKNTAGDSANFSRGWYSLWAEQQSLRYTQSGADGSRRHCLPPKRCTGLRCLSVERMLHGTSAAAGERDGSSEDAS